MAPTPDRYPLTWIAIMVAAIAFFAVLSTTIPPGVYEPGHQPPPPPLGYQLPNGTTLSWRYTVADELYYDAQYPVEAYHLTDYGPVVEIFKSTPSGEPLRQAMVYVLGLNASRISPAAFWSAADMAGYIYAKQGPRSLNYTLYPFPYNTSSTDPPYSNDTINLTLSSVSAQPLHYRYPPSANITQTDGELDGEVSVSESVVNEVQVGYSVTVYYAGTATLYVPIRIYNGSDPCLYVSQNMGAFELAGCGGLVDVKMQVYANTYTGVYQAILDAGKVVDNIAWNGTQIERTWDMGSWRLQATQNDTYGDGPCLLNSSQTCAYTYEDVGAIFTSSVTQPPAWAFPGGHPPEWEVYRYNYAEGFIDGPGYYYGLARFLLNETGGLPFEALWLAGGIGINMSVDNQSYSGSPDPYYSALITGSGNQTLVAMQQFLIAQYMYPVYVVRGSYNDTAPWTYGFIEVNNAPPTSDGLPNYTTDQGYAVMSDTSQRPGGAPLWAWYGCGSPNSNTSVYKPVLSPGDTYRFSEYSQPFQDTPIAYPGQQYTVKVLSINDQLYEYACSAVSE